MADGTIDLIEETSDEMENWLYYNKESKEEEADTDICPFQEDEPDSQLIYVDSTDLVENDAEKTFQYDCDELDNNIDQQALQHNTESKEELQPQIENENDILNHNLILKENIDENGELVKSYFCSECDLSFSTIEDFLSYHRCMELINEDPEQQQPNSVQTETKLWELVENLDEVADNNDTEEIVESKPNVTDNIHQQDVFSQDVDLEKERYFCYDCQQVFTDLTTAENHDCINELTSSLELNEPKSSLLVENEEHNAYRCHLCNKDYTSLRSFNNHQRCHKKTKTQYNVAVVCEVCNTIFATEKNLKLHMKMHKKQSVKTIQDALPVGAQNEYNDLNKFFCEICNKSFDQKLLVIHKNMHQNLEEYSCGKCNKQFENLPSYEIHMQIHGDHLTNINKAMTFKKNNLKEGPSTSASSTLQNGSKRKHSCQYCGKEFLRPYEKVKHERIHTGEKPYDCEVCGKTFRVSYSLTLHLRTHTDIRPYVCATCNKRFKQQSVYVHHLKTHVVERAYKCDICGKSFRTSVQLIGHKNIHSKPYNCTECNRPFASLYSVKIHMKTHSKGHKANKNLKNRCSICGASYARMFALRLHLKEQHGLDVHPTQLLAATSTNVNSTHKKINVKTAILMNSSNEVKNPQILFINADSDEDIQKEKDDNIDANDINEEVFINQVDHEENIHNPYYDETEAATQTILNTEEISADNFTTEEVITDWLTN